VIRRRVRIVLVEVGRVAVASIAASSVMTCSQRLEMRLSRRAASDVPVRVVETLTGYTVAPGLARLIVGHLAQGALAVQAVTITRVSRRLPVAAAVVVNAVVLVLGDAVLVTASGVGTMPWTWSTCDLGTDVLHKTVLAGTATLLTLRGPAYRSNCGPS
jgi:hypothetical protein